MVLRTAMPATQPPPAQQQGQKAAASLSPCHRWFWSIASHPLPFAFARREDRAGCQKSAWGRRCLEASHVPVALMLGSCWEVAPQLPGLQLQYGQLPASVSPDCAG